MSMRATSMIGRNKKRISTDTQSNWDQTIRCVNNNTEGSWNLRFVVSKRASGDPVSDARLLFSASRLSGSASTMTDAGKLWFGINANAVPKNVCYQKFLKINEAVSARSVRFELLRHLAQRSTLGRTSIRAKRLECGPAPNPKIHRRCRQRPRHGQHHFVVSLCLPSNIPRFQSLEVRYS